MCVNTVVRFKIGALTFLSHHEHHQGGPRGAAAGCPVTGSLLFSPCRRQVLGTRPTPVVTTVATLVVCRRSSPCHRPLQVKQPGWFRSAIYTLELKTKGFARSSFWAHSPELRWGPGHGWGLCPTWHSCIHSCLQLHRNSVLPSPSWPVNTSAARSLLSVAWALLQAQPRRVLQSISVF